MLKHLRKVPAHEAAYCNSWIKRQVLQLQGYTAERLTSARALLMRAALCLCSSGRLDEAAPPGVTARRGKRGYDEISAILELLGMTIEEPRSSLAGTGAGARGRDLSA